MIVLSRGAGATVGALPVTICNLEVTEIKSDPAEVVIVNKIIG